MLTYSSSAAYRNNLGTLKIENHNLVFVRRRGLISQKEFVTQTIPIRSIRSLEIQGTRRRMLVIAVDTSVFSGLPRHEFDVPFPEEWIDFIQKEMNVIGAMASQSLQPTYVKEIVREIVKYPCPYCNSLIEINLNKCPSCGAPQKK